MHFSPDWTFQHWQEVNLLILAMRNISPEQQRKIFNDYKANGLPEEPHREFDDDADLSIWEDGLPDCFNNPDF